ncbi:hypothetical protein BH23GEM8_BH23GEM8_06220 [soil metagenome]
MSFRVTLNRTEVSDGWFQILNVGWARLANGCNPHRMGSYQRENADHRLCTIRLVPSRMCRTEVGRGWSRSGLHLHGPRRRPAGLPRRVPSSAFLCVLCGYYRSFSNISRTTYLRRTDEPQRAQRAQRRNGDKTRVPFASRHRACAGWGSSRVGPGVDYIFMAATTTCRLTSPSSVLCVPLRPLRLSSFLLQYQPDDVSPTDG